MSKRPNRLSDPAYAAFAWARYRRIMRWVLAVSMLTVLAALAWLRSDGSPLTVTMVIATIAGVAGSVLMAGALMGLIFLSSGTGHDEEVAAFENEDDGGARYDRRRPR